MSMQVVGRRGRRRVVLGLVAVAAAALGATGSASAAPLKYVALGDSFSAGSGVGPPDTSAFQACIRSDRNYPKLLARRLGASIKDVTCAGADTRAFRNAQYREVGPQLNALSSDTELVTMTIGGNDNSVFFGTLFACAFTGGQGASCEQRYAATNDETLRTKTFPAVVQALKDVHDRAPRATVAILTYPMLLPPTGGCRARVPIAERDVPYIHRLQLQLNEVLRQAARQTGSFLIDVEPASVGHDACQADGVRWVEPASGGQNILHPGAPGMNAMAAKAFDALKDRRDQTTSAVREATRPGVVLTRRAIGSRRLQVGCTLRAATMRSCTVTVLSGSRPLTTVKLTRSRSTRTVTLRSSARRLTLRATALSTGGQRYTTRRTFTRSR